MMTPLFSVFTPTHRTDYLLAAHASLQAQRNAAPWEWVILPNNGCGEIPESIAHDPRVRVLPPMQTSSIGALKNRVASACYGKYLVELDHDDLLASTAFTVIENASDFGSADFIYSDAANFRANGEFQLYGENYGWEHYDEVVDGKPVKVNKAFPLTAASVSQIFYAPNHVRVWKANLSHKLGGHDVTMPVCDDQDLVLRTYLAGAKFAHVPHCLYLYRLQENGGNSWLQRNAEIQKTQQAVANKYLYQAIAEWCRREGLRRIDLGGAIGRPEGFESVDLHGADIKCDLRLGLPFKDNTIGCVRAYDFLEHIPHCRDSTCKHDNACVVHLMNEIHRVLAPGGWLISGTPSTDGRGAFQDPTHCSFWNSNSFWYYTRAQQQRYVPGITARFQATRVWNDFPSQWHKLHNIPYVYADLCALKGQRQPGICEI